MPGSVVAARAQHAVEAEAELRRLDLARVARAHGGEHVGEDEPALQEVERPAELEGVGCEVARGRGSARCQVGGREEALVGEVVDREHVRVRAQLRVERSRSARSSTGTSAACQSWRAPRRAASPSARSHSSAARQKKAKRSALSRIVRRRPRRRAPARSKSAARRPGSVGTAGVRRPPTMRARSATRDDTRAADAPDRAHRPPRDAPRGSPAARPCTSTPGRASAARQRARRTSPRPPVFA